MTSLWGDIIRDVQHIENVDYKLERLGEDMYENLFTGKDNVCTVALIFNIKNNRYNITSKDDSGIQYPAKDGLFTKEFVIFMIRMIIYCSKLYLRIKEFTTISVGSMDTQFVYTFKLNHVDVSMKLVRVDDENIKCVLSRNDKSREDIEIIVHEFDNTKLGTIKDSLDSMCDLVSNKTNRSVDLPVDDSSRSQNKKIPIIQYTTILRLIDIMLHAEGIKEIFDEETIDDLQKLFGKKKQ